MKIRKELWFGFALMALLIAGALYIFLTAETITRGHLGLLMLSLVVVAIMMGFPTAFTLMGMGILFTWLSYDEDITKTLDLFVQSTFKVMSNDVLISIPLFVFMGYLVERANLIEKLFRSLHLAMARIPGSLAVATLVTCAVFATATGIVGAVVTLMGLLAFPAMLKAGYNTKLGAGAVTAGGCLGILIPPSVMLIVYGATAGVSVVQLYAGAFLPGIMLAGLYIAYVIIVAKIWPNMAPPLSEEGRKVKLPPVLEALSADGSRRALPAVLGAFKGRNNSNVETSALVKQGIIVLLPLLFFAFVMGEAYVAVTAAPEAASGLEQMDSSRMTDEPHAAAGGLAEPEGVQEPPSSGGVQEPPAAEGKEPAAAEPAPPAPAPTDAAKTAVDAPVSQPVPTGFWIALGVGTLALVGFYAIFSVKRLEIFRMLLASFFPLVVLILAVLGSIVFGLTTPTEAAAIGAFGGFVLA
ncbi:MAG TPA: TRAP transporter large permease subunit, partial [Burkholderiaceae bacterium]|nr:TRAP transporter large permease subunit [Burkholderiaceae bacterium]